MKKVLIDYYDRCNLGDDLMVEVVKQRYADSFNGIPTQNNKYVRMLLRKRSLNLRVYGRFSDIIIILGGSIFIEQKNIAGWERKRKYITNLKRPYYILGSNIGPYKTKRFLSIVDDILTGAVDVCVRDRYSYELFKSKSNVRLSTDIIFSMNRSLVSKDNGKTVIISVINPQHRFEQKVSQEYFSLISKLCVNLARTGYSITIMSFCKFEGDDEAVNIVYETLDETTRKNVSKYNYDGDLDQALSVIDSSSYIIGTRFHATILGLLLKKKVLPIIYSDKTKNILEDMDFTGPIVDIRHLEKFNAKAFNIAKLKEVSVDKQIKLAKKQFRELDKVLTKRN